MTTEQSNQAIATAAKTITINLKPVLADVALKIGAVSEKITDLEKSSTRLANALNRITLSAVIVAIIGIGWDVIKTLFKLG